MSNNTVEYLIRLRDEFTAKMNAAAGAGAKGGAAIAQGMAVAVAAGLKFKDQISAGWDVLNGNYEALGTVLGALPGPLGEIGQIAGSALGQMISETEQAAEGYRKLSAATGASVEFLSGFKEAADDVRVSGESVDSALTKFARSLGGVKDASEGVAESGKGIAATLADIGVNANDSEGKIRPLADVLPDVADAFMRMADGPQKTALAIQLFGKQGAELIPILNKGKDGIAEMAAEAKALGLTMSGETIQAVDKLKVAQDALGDAWLGFSRRVAPGAITALTSIVDSVNFLTGASGTMTEAFQTVNTTLLQFGNSGQLTAEQLKKLQDAGDNGVAVLKRFAEGGAGSNAETQRLAQELQKVHPELFVLSEAADKAAVSTEALTKAQKTDAELQVEYQTKVGALTEAMSKRDKGLDDLHDKERKLIEAEQQGFITKEQLSAAQGHLQAETAKVKQEFEAAAGKIKDGSTAAEAMGRAAEGAVAGEKAFAEATRDAAKAQEELKEKLDGLTSGIGGLPGKLDAAAKAQLAWKLATGQMTVQEVESKAVGEALTKQYADKKISLEQLIQIGKAYQNGEISAAGALEKAGALTNVAQVKQLKTYREIEQASGVANKSELAYVDTLRIAGGSYKAYTSDAKTLAQAQLDHGAAVGDIKKQTELLNEAEKNGTISKLQNAEAQIYLQGQLTAVNQTLHKQEELYNNGQPVVRSWAKVINESGVSVAEWEQQMRDAGLTTAQVTAVVKEAQDNGYIEVKVDADAEPVKGAVEGVRTLKAEAKDPPNSIPTRVDTTELDGATPRVSAWKSNTEKPVVIPVGMEIKDPNERSASDQMHAALFGGDKTGKAFSIPVAVTVDTSQLDPQMKAAQASLAGFALTKSVTLTLDTAGFDTKIDGIKTKLAGLPDESISISINVPSSLKLPDFSSLSSKSLSISADPSTALGAIKRVNDAVLNPKTLMIYANEVDAQIAMDAIDNDSLEAKTLMIGADNSEALKAMYAVQDYEIFGKTVDVFGSNGSAMGAITAVRKALDDLHDKTVYINVVQAAPPANNSGGPDDRGGGGGGIGPRGAGDNTNNLADGTRGGTFANSKIADTIIVNDERHLEAIILRVMDKRLNG